MDSLFGIPTERLMVALAAVFVAGVVVLAVSGARNRTSLRMAVRNIPRRRAQSVLIVAGLMLATMLFSASFTTGDTLTNSIRAEALGRIGEVDVQIKADTPQESGGAFGAESAGARPTYFDESMAQKVADRLSGESQVDGVAPLLTETAPLVAQGSRLSSPQTDVLGIDDASMGGFDKLLTASGRVLSTEDLGPDEMYLSSDTAEELEATKGDTVSTYIGGRPSELTVAGVYESGANPASKTSAVMALGSLQRLADREGEINSVIVTHTGPALEGAAGTTATVSALNPLLEENGLRADQVKKDALKEADDNGAQFTSIFLLFGQFSVAAGVLLIFLIFVMLAAERKHELGIARAVGMRRGHVVRMFAYEGALYALVACALGSVLGVGVGWAMVQVIARAFSTFDFEISFATSPQNLVIAFTLGMALTFAVVLISSWRVSRLNVIRAIRDLPEPNRRGRSIKGVILAVLTPVAGALLTYGGLQAEQMGLYLLGISLAIIGVALVLRLVRVADRIAFSLAGVALLFLWLDPADLPPLAPAGMSQSIDMFFISGIMMVLAAIWLVVYNADVLLRGIVAVFGRLRGLPPVLKTAVKYPMQSRFRTGMTLAMFSLVIFTLVTMSFINRGINSMFTDTDRISGGYELQADAGYAAPVADMNQALKQKQNIDSDDIEAVGSVSGLPVEAKQEGTDHKAKNLFVRGVDRGYSQSVGYGFNTTAAEYSSAREVWNALQEEGNVAVISAALAPARSSMSVGAPPPPIEMEGFYQEDAQLPDDLYIKVEDPASGNVERLRVIGVLEDTAFFAGDVLTSQQSLEGIAEGPVPSQTYMIGLADGTGAREMASKMEEDFVRNGLQVEVMEEVIRESSAANSIMNNLLTGFMGLGLMVGIAALGVISARAVVERRQQIGMLRALGFQKGQVRLTFLLESSFVALLGIAIGVGLGVGLSREVIDGMSQEIGGITYSVPWFSLAVIVTLSYVASLLTTYLPARGASKVYPAEALRYE